MYVLYIAQRNLADSQAEIGIIHQDRLLHCSVILYSPIVQHFTLIVLFAS